VLHPGAPAVPMVPAAVIYDLTNGGDKSWVEPPYRALGAQALAAADAGFALGKTGAGYGARAGTLPGGLGSASLELGDGLIVGALMVANPVGSVLTPCGNAYWAWPFEIDGEFGGQRPQPECHAREPFPDTSRLASRAKLMGGANTTIGVVATNLSLTTAECQRVAMMAQDGIARAVRPAHTPFDGDLLFCVSTGTASPTVDGARAMTIARIGSALADCVARAIARAVHFAQVP
jgi:L-aminopeptidase/D-esterase-like protein